MLETFDIYVSNIPPPTPKALLQGMEEVKTHRFTNANKQRNPTVSVCKQLYKYKNRPVCETENKNPFFTYAFTPNATYFSST